MLNFLYDNEELSLQRLPTYNDKGQEKKISVDTTLIDKLLGFSDRNNELNQVPLLKEISVLSMKTKVDLIKLQEIIKKQGDKRLSINEILMEYNKIPGIQKIAKFFVSNIFQNT